MEQLEKCFDYKKFQANREVPYLWSKFRDFIPTRTGQQIKDKVRNLHFAWTLQQKEEKKEAEENGTDFEAVVFQNLDTYMGELETCKRKVEEEEEEEEQSLKKFKSADRRKAARLEQAAIKAELDNCYVLIEKYDM